jgi:type VI secretion system secreted protein Hcp
MDIASVQLMIEAATGKSLTKATFHWIQTSSSDKSNSQVYLEVILDKPILSSYSMSSGGERPVESISINYNAITMQYKQYQEGGTVIDGESKGYDLRTNLPKAKI